MKMRKLLAVIAAVLAMTLVLAACSTNVDGKTFKFDSVSIEWTDDATEAEKAALVALVQSGSEDTITKDNVLDKFEEIVSKQAAENSPSFTFEDGKVKAGSAPATEYTQEGEKVTIGSGESAVTITAKGGKLYWDMADMFGMSDMPVTIEAVFVQA